MDDKNIHDQEIKCLEAKHMIDLLLTRLFEIEDFHDFKSWNHKLKSLKKQLDNIYWNL